MKKEFLAGLICMLLVCISHAQSVGVGTTSPDASSVLEIKSSSKGLLIPRMSTAAISALLTPAKGLFVYDTTRNQLDVNMGTSSSPDWETVVYKSGWSLQGNSGVNPSINFIGTTDLTPLAFRVNNVKSGLIDSSSMSTSFGYGTFQSNTSGRWNTAFGFQAMYTNTTGESNTAMGTNALSFNTSGGDNTSIGYYSLYANTQGSENTAVGEGALYRNFNGNSNTAIGYLSLYGNQGGQNNTAVGFGAEENTAGSDNASLGYYSLLQNLSGAQNVALGNYALRSNRNSYNTAVGYQALLNTTNSQYNTAIGYNAGVNNDLGYNNTILGANCDVQGTGLFNCIAIGQAVTCNASSQARIGNSATSSIGGYANWSNISDGRYKKNIQENVKGIEFIMKLRPITYQLDVQALSNRLNESRGMEVVNAAMQQSIADKEKITFSGFVAQEVEAAAQQLGYNFSGVDAPKNANDLYALRYAEFVVPLTKAVQEQQAMIDEQKRLINAQQQMIEALEKRVEALEKSPHPPVSKTR